MIPEPFQGEATPLHPGNITAVVLAGGRGRRMGGVDKGLVTLNGRPLIKQALDAIEPQVGAVVINANRNIDRYRELGHPVLQDVMDGYQGPLAGFSSALAAAATDYVIFLPCDAPLLPGDYVERMAAGLRSQNATLAVAHDGVRMQPVHALMPCSIRPDLERYLAGGERKIDLWFARHQTALVDFSDCAGAFRNINTQADRDNLQQKGDAA